LLTDQDPLRPATSGAQPPSAEHWMGTNTIGIDEMSRVLHGGQISLKVGLAVALASGILGVIIGALAAYYGGWLDNMLMRVTDLFLAIPLLVVLIIMSKLPDQQAWARTLMGPTGSLRSVVTILSLFFWMPMARIVRGQILSLKEKEFIEAARAIGAPNRRILLRHLIPNCTGPIVVAVTLAVAAAILTEAALSFLGYGINTTAVPTWGYMISLDKSSYDIAPWLVLFPGLAILLVVLCVNYLGDGLRDALDPKQRKAS
jgi:peptide/nickel transport system permease protein